jgi:hypothetical protein
LIDFVKILIENPDPTFLQETNQLEFKVEVSEKTGEVSTKKIANYHFCKIIIYSSGRVSFQGSLHKLYNSLNGIQAPNFNKYYNKGFNGNLFTFKQIKYSIQHIAKLLNVKVCQLRFQNIEFGLNTELDFDPQTFIKGLLIQRNKVFELKHSQRFAQAIHNRYYLKIYNKGKQYKLAKNTLRVEVKIIKSEHLKQLKISTAADINKKTLYKAFKLLLRHFSEVIYYDHTINTKSLKTRKGNLLYKYQINHYWLGLKSNKRDAPKKKLQYLIDNHSDNLKKQIETDMQRQYKRVIINHSSIELTTTLKQSVNTLTTKNRNYSELHTNQVT